ncbi:MAG: FABP family protein [Sinobacterium sp.]|nr:FABP family protein [Sinobacterium sp.]
MTTMINGLDYGPIACLVGKWKGDRGLDIAPDNDASDGVERNPYNETITYEAIGDVKNANEQTLAIVRYHQVVIETATNEQFHDQVGYWTWDSATGVVTHSLTIPRACALLAGGKGTIDGDKVTLTVEASLDNEDFTVAQSDFMFSKAKTTAFSMTVEVEGDNMSYRESTMLDIYGGRQFDHRDKSVLTRV